MSMLSCPHCHATITVAGFAPGQAVACGHCGNALQIPAQEVPLASPSVPQETPLASPPRPAPMAASPVPAPQAVPVSQHSPPPQPAPFASSQPAPLSTPPGPAPPGQREESKSTYVPTRRKRSSPVVTMLIVVVGTALLLGGGLLVGGAMLWQTSMPEKETPVAGGGQNGQVKKKPVGGRVRLESSGYKPQGPRLDITRSQFRDQVEMMPYYYDNGTALRWFYSGQKFVDAFGRPHRVRTVNEDVLYYWNCNDGTLSVVTKASNLPLEQRNSADGSALIVYRIDDEFY